MGTRESWGEAGQGEQPVRLAGLRCQLLRVLIFSLFSRPTTTKEEGLFVVYLPWG